jgi:hypothetical protein
MIGCASTEVIDSTEDYTQRILLSSILKIGSGDSGTSVTELLGAPTVIAKNASGNEMWIYTRIEVYEEAGSDIGAAISRPERSALASRPSNSSSPFSLTVYFNSDGEVKGLTPRRLDSFYN